MLRVSPLLLKEDLTNKNGPKDIHGRHQPLLSVEDFATQTIEASISDEALAMAINGGFPNMKLGKMPQNTGYLPLLLIELIM